MKTSIATVSISGNFPEKLEAIAAAGFDGIEIFEQDFIAHDGDPKEVGDMIRAMGLEITLFQPFRDFEGLPEPHRAKVFDRVERKFDLMQDLGTDLVLICSSCHPEALGGIDRSAADFNELGDRAAKRGLRVGYEALAWGRHVNDHRDAWEIVRRADHGSVGLILDSFHTLARRIDPETIRRIPGDKIFFVQLADAPAIDMDLLYWSRHFRNMPGEGDLDVTGFMKAVMATGYTGPISLEIFNDQFRGGHPKTIAKDGYRSLVALMDDVRREEPATTPTTPALPKRSKVEGVSFVEFAARGAEADTLERLLETLGFTLSGTHIAKKLSLWTQGDIRIVVNRETTGYASSAYTTHGTTVCDIGISVDAATETVSRAKALGAAPFHQPIGPGELDIPAIRGLSGSVLHFIDQTSGLNDVWSVEFNQTDAEQTHAGLTSIDHIAQTMSYDEMLSWSLFYTTLFDMEKSPMVDVVDPDGLVRSQALETRDGAFRITLNGAETHRTMAGNFLADSFGASVQHIALASEDIFATSSAMRAKGFEPLPISDNYYADLVARFDLDADMLSALKAGNILYDEDAKGAFFQFYSRPYAGGMFFEIVERRGGYAGYGAPNAPFRIAAQKRLMRPKGMPKI
ncbi:sugar phosphate isomerase/epimerase and 4-hydroxyphenylpyruvate domain-containing protein [Sulfitobacter sp. KE29]|uniref:bifunctional sugar phosphate isomerase/epimerase/4-hydroxyphenylpyruvate dioxygenase family protein n=1 Tax=Sulfitobacter TaxID=60136 RepID=UPI0023E2475D|nr:MULTISPECIES: sugar phosphate isomerase/epimerase and 4-hydroxyphenylpyruvate domain-containing protein [Sulfitobacter]MDF3418900.1 sugar phosphate isomerase/epimerase and 4-hydroxyphenylpyruvate domain-containing protein [Sulfitobacter sp. Ks38]MDF3426382.1 sugar phosphate isomerase/epimerase and 4-hydroxyphenylpyruvate domain-containing protein [Sulfitobacter sp. KE29]MDF3429963.1 sugar phosphate isomerase/epimerase and 4-hydroxyphenylpyruvate domain-containing protein [Sulfitobacter sp. S4